MCFKHPLLPKKIVRKSNKRKNISGIFSSLAQQKKCYSTALQTVETAKYKSNETKTNHVLFIQKRTTQTIKLGMKFYSTLFNMEIKGYFFRHLSNWSWICSLCNSNSKCHFPDIAWLNDWEMVRFWTTNDIRKRLISRWLKRTSKTRDNIWSCVLVQWIYLLFHTWYISGEYSY